MRPGFVDNDVQYGGARDAHRRHDSNLHSKVAGSCPTSGERLLMDPDIRPLRPLGSARLLGVAVTPWCEPGDIGAAIHVIEHAKAGDVVVIDANANLQSAVVCEHSCGVAAARALPVSSRTARMIFAITPGQDGPFQVPSRAVNR